MTRAEARQRLVQFSLAASAGALVFFTVAPALGYPLDYEQALRLLQIIIPAFSGYLGSATIFIFKGKRSEPPLSEEQASLLGVLVKGPPLLFAVATGAVLVGFGLSNSSFASLGAGMRVDTLATVLSVLLGVLSLTTSVLVTYLFVAHSTTTSDKSSSAIPGTDRKAEEPTAEKAGGRAMSLDTEHED
ncbi:MAG: hypothetical protein JWP01_3976 [Myxococcales bacterium]|nr:hypothetical protein [Myxococcales bacterium]